MLTNPLCPHSVPVARLGGSVLVAFGVDGGQQGVGLLLPVPAVAVEGRCCSERAPG